MLSKNITENFISFFIEVDLATIEVIRFYSFTVVYDEYIFFFAHLFQMIVYFNAFLV